MTTFVRDEPQVKGDKVHEAARDFSVALSETPEFSAYEAAAEQYRHDQTAQQAMAAYQAKQRSLDMMLRLNAASAEERGELDRLYQAVTSVPSVTAYVESQAALMAVCRGVAKYLSERIGLDYASACGASCGCG